MDRITASELLFDKQCMTLRLVVQVAAANVNRLRLSLLLTSAPAVERRSCQNSFTDFNLADRVSLTSKLLSWWKSDVLTVWLNFPCVEAQHRLRYLPLTVPLLPHAHLMTPHDLCDTCTGRAHSNRPGHEDDGLFMNKCTLVTGQQCYDQSNLSHETPSIRKRWH
jgi:hypothetical protein